jgi:hypothetical protein
MKKVSLLLVMLAALLWASAQTFPGLTASQKKQLLTCGYKVPMPTWLPAGFKVDSLVTLTGKSVSIEEKTLLVHFAKEVKPGTQQAFTIMAGFDGLGSLWYKSEKIQSGVGVVEMYYQPYEEPVDGKREQVKDLIATEWFTVGKTDFNITVSTPFDQYAEEYAEESGVRYEVISKTDFKKILQSLKVLK